MVEPEPTLEEWHSLYQAAMHFKEVAPWEWMDEEEIFGVQDPETGELGFASVMGALGEHLSLAVYRGVEGLYTFWYYNELGENAPTDSIMDMPHMQAAFEDRELLTAKDRKVIKELGFKFHGRQAWPWFRSFRTGFYPWYLEGWEARFLTHALEQAIDVALRFKEDPDLVICDDSVNYLVRVPHKQGGMLVWQDEIHTIPPPTLPPIPLLIDLETLEKLKQLPQPKITLEIDLVPLRLATTDGKDPRPYFPFLLLVVDGSSGMILKSEFLKPDPTVLELFSNVPLRLLYQFARMGCVPSKIKVRNDLLVGLISQLAAELNFDLKKVNKLRFLDPALDFLLNNPMFQE